jgi:mRNA interferase MazF
MPMKKPTASSDREKFTSFDVVLVPFPYADRLAEKRRPALVVSSSKLSRFGLVWVTMITTAENGPWPSDVVISDLERAGLPAPSVVRTAKIACIDPARIDRRLGRLDKAAARHVSQQIRAFLGTA